MRLELEAVMVRPSLGGLPPRTELPRSSARMLGGAIVVHSVLLVFFEEEEEEEEEEEGLGDCYEDELLGEPDL